MTGPPSAKPAEVLRNIELAPPKQSNILGTSNKRRRVTGRKYNKSEKKERKLELEAHGRDIEDLGKILQGYRSYPPSLK
jgi:hypothetical protein